MSNGVATKKHLTSIVFDRMIKSYFKGGYIYAVRKSRKNYYHFAAGLLASIKKEVSSGSYGSTSELIREAMKLWQKKKKNTRQEFL